MKIKIIHSTVHNHEKKLNTAIEILKNANLKIIGIKPMVDYSNDNKSYNMVTTILYVSKDEYRNEIINNILL